MLSLAPEPSEQVIARLGRECEHLAEQLNVAHGMFLHWQARAIAAERQLERLQRKTDRAQHPKDVPTPRRGDGVHAPADLLEEGGVDDSLSLT